ncbi:MAG: hypothetical protein ACTSYR_00145 [Candidatus Odinarchaeia archaeon]
MNVLLVDLNDTLNDSIMAELRAMQLIRKEYNPIDKPSIGLLRRIMIEQRLSLRS